VKGVARLVWLAESMDGSRSGVVVIELWRAGRDDTRSAGSAGSFAISGPPGREAMLARRSGSLFGTPAVIRLRHAEPRAACQRYTLFAGCHVMEQVTRQVAQNTAQSAGEASSEPHFERNASC
jgi:hypothetical protein